MHIKYIAHACKLTNYIKLYATDTILFIYFANVFYMEKYKNYLDKGEDKYSIYIER